MGDPKALVHGRYLNRAPNAPLCKTAPFRFGARAQRLGLVDATNGPSSSARVVFRLTRFAHSLMLGGLELLTELLQILTAQGFGNPFKQISFFLARAEFYSGDPQTVAA